MFTNSRKETEIVMKIFSTKALVAAAIILSSSCMYHAIQSPAVFAAKVETTTVVTVEQKTQVNWEKGADSEVVAMGIGLPPQNAVGAQGKVLARRAAVVDAQRNLVETINGVQVDAETTVENLMVTSDVVKTRVAGLIKGATIVSEQQNPDGSYSVIMRVPIYGVSGSLGAAIVDEALKNAPEPAPAPLLPNVKGAAEDARLEAANIIAAAKAEAANIIAAARKQADAIIAEAKGTTNAPSAVAATAPVAESKVTVLNASEIRELDSNEYTGVIIDASGLPLEATFSPVIYDVKGRAIYGMKNVNPDFAISKGMVEYSRNLEQSKLQSRAGSNPLILKAASVSGGKNSTNKVNVVVSEADGDKILLANEKNSMLKQCSVVFVR